jgi:hypothetical protein
VVSDRAGGRGNQDLSRVADFQRGAFGPALPAAGGVRSGRLLGTVGRGIPREAAAILRDVSGEPAGYALGTVPWLAAGGGNAARDYVRVRLRFDAEEEAIQFALSFGGDVEAVEPHELRAKVLAGALPPCSAIRAGESSHFLTISKGHR